MDIQSTKHYAVATLLDPRFKGKFLKDEYSAKDWVLEDLLANEEAWDTDTSDELPTLDQDDDTGEEYLKSRINKDLWSCYNEFVNGNGSGEDKEDSSSIASSVQSQGNITSVYNAELAKYLSLPVISRSDDADLWWKTHALEYPNLSNLATKYLSAPPSSVFSERLFSHCKNAFRKNRCRLAPTSGEMLIFMMRNMKFANFIY